MDKKELHIITAALAVIVIAGLFCVVFNGKEKKVGLYGYVRKADKYIEEGKYKKAIFLLHKAYERSPGSEKIKETLIYGYIKYFRFLDRTGEIDRAMEYLSMAYEMAGSNIAVVHDLAYIYAKKAVVESENKKFGTALEYFRKASDLAMISKKVRKSISNYLFNEAVGAYNDGHGKTALLCLNTSYVLKTRFETLDFLGQYYYRESRLKKALFYWGKALALRPDDDDMRGKIEKISKEMLLKKKMKKIETPHFNVQFYGNYRIDPEILNNTLGDVYDKVGRDLDCYPPATTPIIFYGEDDFRQIFKQKGLVRAFYDGKIRMVFPDDEPVFPGVVSHEYTHAVISILTDNKCPTWLHEGVAVVEQLRYMPQSLENIKVLVNSGKELSLDDIQRGFLSMDDEKLLRLSYAGAYTAVSFILDKWGWDGLRGLLARIKAGRHFANAIDEEFYISVKAFEVLWNEDLKHKFSE